MKQPSILSSLTLLGAVTLFFCFALMRVDAFTAPRIAVYDILRKEQAALQAAGATLLRPLFPEATSFEKIGATKFHDNTACYFRVKKDTDVVGYGIDAFGEGAVDMIHAIVGVNPDYTIKSVRVLFQDETKGMGNQIAEEPFLRQFIGKNPDRLHVITEGDTTDAITAITGATVSSAALAEDAVKSAVLFLKTEGIQ